MATPAPKSDRSGEFVTVDVTGPATTRSAEFGALEITTPSGYRLTVTRDFDAEHLRRVVQALERCC